MEIKAACPMNTNPTHVLSQANLLVVASTTSNTIAIGSIDHGPHKNPERINHGCNNTGITNKRTIKRRSTASWTPTMIKTSTLNISVYHKHQSRASIITDTTFPPASTLHSPMSLTNHRTGTKNHENRAHITQPRNQPSQPKPRPSRGLQSGLTS